MNKTEIFKKIDDDQQLKLRFQYIDETHLMLLNSIMVRYLSKMDHLYLLNSINTILREVVVNALKANAKRVYFKKLSLDINNPADYITGMKQFKQNVIGEFDQISADLKRSDYFVNLNFKMENENLLMTLQNNSPILPEELKRVQHRISKAIQYNDFSEAYQEVEDDSEGAGLGIVLTILLLKNMGIDPHTFKIQSDSRLTTTYLMVPKNLKTAEIITSIKKRILREVEGIPTFPENIHHLQRLCADPEATIDQISKKILLDPALTSDVIKLSNSAGFVPGKRIENINTAVKTIGLKNLNAVLIASSARMILNQRYSSFEQIWEHCNRVAFYARNIAIAYKKQAIIENAFMAGLLHDLGKIILLATDLKLVEKISNIVMDRKIRTSTIMEEITIGISHSTLGALIAEKWNFPDYLVETIRHHHAPHNSINHPDLVDVVYIANMMCGIETRKYYYNYLDEGILSSYDLATESKFKALHNKLKTRYEANPK
jgi:putative nucleotidyltransferase with HDIG domain